MAYGDRNKASILVMVASPDRFEQLNLIKLRNNQEVEQINYLAESAENKALFTDMNGFG